MTREQIEAELKTFPFANLHPLTPDMTILFAQHIAKLEREECARICSDKFEKWEYTLQDPRMLAKEILARGDE